MAPDPVDPASETVAERDRRETVAEHDDREAVALAELAAAVEVVGDVRVVLRGLRDDVAAERSARRWQAALLALLVGLNLWLSTGLLARDRDRCEQSNEGRADLVEAFDLLIAASVAEDPDPGAVTRAAEFADLIASSFAPRDC